MKENGASPADGAAVVEWRGGPRTGWMVMLVAIVLGAWTIALWANWRGYLPGFVLWAVLPAALLVLMWLGMAHAPDRLRERATLRWSDLRVVRTATMACEGERDQALTLLLTESLDPNAPSLVVRFHGVSDLRLGQFDDYPMGHGGLRVEQLAGEKVPRYRVRDFEGLIDFRCREIHEETA